MYANCMQMLKKAKGFHCLKPFTVLSGPNWARSSDPLIMSPKIYFYTCFNYFNLLF